MGITSAWAVSAHPDTFIAQLAPRMLPLLQAWQSDPAAGRLWRRWQEAPLPDFRTWGRGFGDDYQSEEAGRIRDFYQLIGAFGPMDDMYDGGPDTHDDFHLLTDVWERDEDPERMFIHVCSKDYALASFFHAIEPRRAALLPGWCGNFLLTSAQVRHSLPDVENALSFAPEERAAAAGQDWLGDPADGRALAARMVPSTAAPGSWQLPGGLAVAWRFCGISPRAGRCWTSRSWPDRPHENSPTI
ncbi:hypothetical protein FM076_32930 [Streptomyces albus subsp. chlorinus]|uniref:hypothetical protein n=1 Tax=Streptomyces albus TaxID=1888 RepID=UPI001570C636|nr:hypothetical protein [Streptomyces albus]NSC25695.1 hypothetical protein [Streptomyces albus subsp. chlorinus]